MDWEAAAGENVSLPDVEIETCRARLAMSPSPPCFLSSFSAAIVHHRRQHRRQLFAT